MRVYLAWWESVHIMYLKNHEDEKEDIILLFLFVLFLRTLTLQLKQGRPVLKY